MNKKRIYQGLRKFSFFISGRAYDRAAIKFRGAEADINFSIEDYEEDLKQVRILERDRDRERR